MRLKHRIAPSGVAMVTLLCCAASARGDDTTAFQASVQDLAHASRTAYDPAFLVGIGEVYCHMKALVGEEQPLRPELVLTVLHQKHPDTQPRTKVARDAQRRAVILAATLLCPDAPQGTSPVP